MNFRAYDQNQGIFAPIIPADVIDDEDPARIIDEIIESLDLSTLYDFYSDEGNPAYHPKMMLKVLFFCYLKGIFSCRKINEGLKKYMMQLVYLSGGDTPSFSTINNFRLRHLNVLPEIFAQIVLLCVELEMVDFEFLAIDGQKIQASASFKQSKREKDLKKELERIEIRMKDLLTRGEQITSDGKERYDLDKKTARLKRRELKVKAAVEKLKELQALEKDEKAKEEKRINVTDNDAPVMTHKDSTKKPSYETYAASDGKFQVITAYDCKADSSEAKEAIPMLEKSEENASGSHAKAALDAGFSSFENLEKMEEIETEIFMPDRKYDKWSKDAPSMAFDKSKFNFAAETNSMTCPLGNVMELSRVEDKGDFKRFLFRGLSCGDCEKKAECTDGKVRTVTMDSRNELQDKMREKLKSGKGKEIYQKRQTTVEPVFGNIQKNMGWKQFHLRGKEKVRGEFGLIAIAHNLKKIVLHLSELRIDLKTALSMMKLKYSAC